MMRAKMLITGIVPFTNGETLTMMAVCGNKPFGPNGEHEDNTFARWTPSGSLSLTITNPDLVGKFKEGDTFYVDFTAAPKA